MRFPESMKKHPVFAGTIFFLFLVVLWIGYFLGTFDLNDYRRQLQDTLSAHLSLPVRLGNAHLKLGDAGVVLSFSDVAIGDETTAAALASNELWLTLEWKSLFRQKLGFSNISLLQPELRLTLPSRAANGSVGGYALQPFLIDGVPLKGFKVRSLKIREGRLQLMQSDADRQPGNLELHHIQAELTGLARGGTLGINLTAGIPGGAEPANLSLDGNLEVPADLPAWRRASLDLVADLAGVTDETLRQLSIPHAAEMHFTGTANLAGQFSGSLAEGISLSIKLNGDDLAVKAGPLPAPHPVRHLEISGLLTMEGSRGRLDNMVVGLNEMQMTGQAVGFNGPTGPQLEIALSGGRLPVASLAGLLAGQGQLSSLRESEGTLWIDKGAVTLVANGDAGKALKVEQFEVDVSLKDLTWRMHPDFPVLIQQASLQGRKEHWTISRGEGFLGTVPIALEGEIDLLAEPLPAFDLHLDGSVALEDLPDFLSGPLPAEFPTVKGSLPFLAQLNGDTRSINLDIDADFSQVEMIYGDNLRLPPADESRLSLHGSLQENILEIGHFKLQRQPFTVTASGRAAWDQQPEVDILGLVALHQAAELAALFPDLEPYEVSGQANLEFTLKGPLASLHHTAVLALEDVGFTTRGVTAAVSQLQGRLRLQNDGFASEKMLARLGESAVSFEARLQDFSNPELVLDIQADKLNADDLIFPADLMHLLDVRGQLRITPDKVAFAPVRARLPQGTRARVEGQATVEPDLQVDLAFTSEFADVREIIALWTRMSPEAREKMRARRKTRQARPPKPHQVNIHVQAEQGNLYGMGFQGATATIVHTPGQLVIHPLDFQVDGGHSTAQVIVDFKRSEPPLLRVSGHAENIDAYRIYNELLDQDSILRGSLRGDFYLQGEIGPSYLPSSFGNFDIQIEDGVLRKFHVLSKIFSLLNVSQIFSLELPDMDVEGMPYDSIRGSLHMAQGVLSTESLLVKSDAMNQSYIGQVNLIDRTVDLTVAVQPLGTVDKILSRIPVAGWLLTGEEKALITTHFSVQGTLPKPDVGIKPVTSISEKTFGLFRRTLGLPMKLVTEPAEVLGVPGGKDQ